MQSDLVLFGQSLLHLSANVYIDCKDAMLYWTREAEAGVEMEMNKKEDMWESQLVQHKQE